MGNRAVITTPDKKMGVYLHWNGGRDSVEAFLHYCELHGFRSPDRDPYGWARLCQVIGNFFGGGLSVGVGLYDQLDTDNWDNGVYIIEGWRIVGREFNRYAEQDSYDHMDMLHDIDDSQPEGMRLGRYIDAVEVPVSEVEEGEEGVDFIYFEDDGYGRYRDDMGRAVFDACAPVIGAGSVLVFMENWDEAEEKDPRIWRYTFDGEKMRVQDGRFVF